MTDEDHAPRQAHVRIESGLFGRKVSVQAGKQNESGDQNGDTDSNDHWYKKPVGIIILSVTAGFIVLMIGAALRHLFPGLFFAQ